MKNRNLIITILILIIIFAIISPELYVQWTLKERKVRTWEW
jgi:hypothetical protein